MKKKCDESNLFITEVNPTNNASNGDMLLKDYFGKIKDSFSIIDLNVESGSVSSLSQLQEIFVSVPTNVSIDIVVKNKKVIEVQENGSKYLVGKSENKYRDCINRFNEIISRGDEAGGLDFSKRSLLLRPYWKDGTIKNFICLKPIDVISINQYSIVLGGPGSGKSTLLKHLSILLAKQYYSKDNLLREDAYSEFFYNNRYIPIFVQLRSLFNDLSIRTDPVRNTTKEALLKFILENWFGNGSINTLQAVLESNNIIIFFDGIDEIFAEKEIPQIVRRLVDISNDINPKAKIVFSSRKESYSTWQLKEFSSFELLPMDKSCQQLLAKKVLSSYQYPDSEFQEKFRVLVKQLEDCELDEKIVGNPLFLSLMVVIYAVNGNLPDQKSVILEKSIRFLIKRWQNKISQENSTKAQADVAYTYELEQLYSALKEIAYVTINEASSRTNPLIIQKSQIITVLSNLVSNNALTSFIPNRNVGEKGEMLLRCLLDSVGVIIPSNVSEAFEFSHRHFQEYLVASKLVDMSNLPNVLMEMIASNGGIHHETIYFMVMEILFDRDNHSFIWSILRHLAFSDDPMMGLSAHLNSWITWFCCCVISIRDYALVSTIYEDRFSGTAEILKRINHRANGLLISQSKDLSLRQRIECARYLGEISEKTIAKSAENGKDFIRAVSLDLGDKREGISLTCDGVPDILWCKIKSGKLVMGIGRDLEEDNIVRRENPNADFSREEPCVELNIKPFEISKYPITIAQYMAFVKDGAYNKPDFWNWSKVSKEWYKYVGSQKHFRPPNVSNAPIVDISWIEAAGFCVWLGNLTKTKIRLPFECEWEYVAKLHHRTYSYSDNFDTEMYVSKSLEFDKAAPVGVYVSEYTDYPSDLTGNVWEWTQTLMPSKCETLDGYANALSKRNVYLPSEAIDMNSRMVARGGSFLNLAFQTRNSYRGRDYIWNHITARQGFRLVRELKDEE